MLRRTTYLTGCSLLVMTLWSGCLAFAGQTTTPNDPCAGTGRPDLYNKAIEAAGSSVKREVASTANTLAEISAEKTLENCLDKYKNFSISGLLGIGTFNLDGLLNNLAKSACSAVDSTYNNVVRTVSNKTGSVLPGGIGVDSGLNLPTTEAMSQGKTGDLINYSVKRTDEDPISDSITHQMETAVRSAGSTVTNKANGAVNKTGTIKNIFNNGNGIFK